MGRFTSCPSGIPSIAAQGLDIKVGRWYAPFGEESIEAVSTPLVSRSYTFNNGPEFTNTGVLATLTINPVWTVAGGYAIGNDIFFDNGTESRFVGFVKWTQPQTTSATGGRNTVTLATTLGRGKFNPNAPLEAPEAAAGDTITTSGIGGETVGRNNINVVDMLYTHTFNPVLSYAAEALYGWQTGIGYDTSSSSPASPPGDGTARWASLANYLGYTVSPRTAATLRVEGFDDYEGLANRVSKVSTPRSPAVWQSSCVPASSSAPNCATTGMGSPGHLTPESIHPMTCSPPPWM